MTQAPTPASEPGHVQPLAPAMGDPQRGDRSIVRRLWDVFRREPMLLVTSSYLFVSIIGLLDSYLFYRRFDLPILEYMQTGDFFVAGLRRPDYLLVLLWTLLVAFAALWPERIRKRDPERAARIERRWWGRLFLPRRTDWWAYLGLHPETMATLSGLLVMLLILSGFSEERASDIRRGAGNVVIVALNDGAPPGGDWRLLGTSSAFVFLWNPVEERSEIVPIESIATIRPAGWQSPRSRDAAAGPQRAAPASPTTGDDGSATNTAPQ